MLDSATAQALYRDACRFDVLALKPGNVAIAEPAHGMVALDFLHSARVSAAPLTDQSLTLGRALEQAARATRRAVGCNTNLGILLLCAPLLHAAIHPAPTLRLASRVADLLAATTVDDAAGAFAAIRCANPAGLGVAEREDVTTPPTQTLTAVMRLAADRDTIAAQYAGDFCDIFNEGVATLAASAAQGHPLTWATTDCFLGWLVGRPDSHLLRKFGADTATWVQGEARAVVSAIKACQNPARRKARLMAFDRKLKAAGLNPGTSADLTVASLLAWRLDRALAR